MRERAPAVLFQLVSIPSDFTRFHSRSLGIGRKAPCMRSAATHCWLASNSPSFMRRVCGLPATDTSRCPAQTDLDEAITLRYLAVLQQYGVKEMEVKPPPLGENVSLSCYSERGGSSFYPCEKNIRWRWGLRLMTTYVCTWVQTPRMPFTAHGRDSVYFGITPP